MATFVLTVVGDDRPGLVSSLSSTVADHGGNWLTSRMAQLAGQFAGIVLVEVPTERAGQLRESLEALAATGLRVEVTAAGEPAPERGPAARPATGATGATGATSATSATGAGGGDREFRLTLLGDDRPGIVRQVTGALARHGVSVEELETGTREAPMAGGLLFEARARLLVPADADLEGLRAALEQIAGELVVDLDLEDR